MTYHLAQSILVTVALLTVVPAVRAEPQGSIGRHLGIGWSDGYHSRAACPPKGAMIHHRTMNVPVTTPATTTPIPWWMVPATSSEQLPTPAGQMPTTSRSSVPAGPSLFRQPGEGSSIKR